MPFSDGSAPVRITKKPIPVDAILWTGSNAERVRMFTGEACFAVILPENREDDPEVSALVWDKLHNTWVGVKDGQHIIKGVEGEFYPIDPVPLAKTYDPPGA